ncbi:MAG TPA: hypothetical protein VF983_02535 [Streptosporangiaceae bacterium]
MKGALCDESSRAELRKIGAAFDWDAVTAQTEKNRAATGPATQENGTGTG